MTSVGKNEIVVRSCFCWVLNVCRGQQLIFVIWGIAVIISMKFKNGPTQMWSMACMHRSRGLRMLWHMQCSSWEFTITVVLQVLLVSSSRYPDQWIVPGGGMEPEEEPGGAAVREVYEEVSRRQGPWFTNGGLCHLYWREGKTTRCHMGTFLLPGSAFWSKWL